MYTCDRRISICHIVNWFTLVGQCDLKEVRVYHLKKIMIPRLFTQFEAKSIIKLFLFNKIIILFLIIFLQFENMFNGLHNLKKIYGDIATRQRKKLENFTFLDGLYPYHNCSNKLWLNFLFFLFSNFHITLNDEIFFVIVMNKNTLKFNLISWKFKLCKKANIHISWVWTFQQYQ